MLKFFSRNLFTLNSSATYLMLAGLKCLIYRKETIILPGTHISIDAAMFIYKNYIIRGPQVLTEL